MMQLVWQYVSYHAPCVCDDGQHGSRLACLFVRGVQGIFIQLLMNVYYDVAYLLLLPE